MRDLHDALRSAKAGANGVHAGGVDIRTAAAMRQVAQAVNNQAVTIQCLVRALFGLPILGRIIERRYNRMAEELEAELNARAQEPAGQ